MKTVSTCFRFSFPSRVLRSFFALLIDVFTFHSILIWGPNATADEMFSCMPSPIAFSAIGATGLVEDLRKLSRREFGFNRLAPASDPSLRRGTELSVLVDQTCLFDSTRGPARLPWLFALKARLAPEHHGSRSFVWRLDRDWNFSELLNAVEVEPCVRLVSPNSSYHMLGLPSDPLLTSQEHLKAVHFAEAMTDFMEPILVRKPIVIAVIDSGVDFSHEDLRLNRWINPNEVAANGMDDDGNGYVDDINGYNFANDVGDAGPQGDSVESKHGTHVAGLAAGRLDNGIGGSGVNGVAKIMSLNIFGSTNTTRSSLLENAIRYAADQGADVINLSLGGREYSRTMRSALDYAIDKGSFIVTAAGNFGFEICDDPESFGFVSPAAYSTSIDGMMVTGSIDAATGKISSFSNYSRRLVEITAPGAYLSDTKIGLLSTFPGNQYSYLAGTSMAAPVLSGAASLVITWLKAYGYSVSPQRVEMILRQGSRHDPALIGFVQDGRTIDLKTLVAFLKEHYPPRR